MIVFDGPFADTTTAALPFRIAGFYAMATTQVVTMICPNLKCRRTLVAPESMRGKIVRCAHCRQPFMVPLRRQEVLIPLESRDLNGEKEKDKEKDNQKEKGGDKK